MSLSVMQRVATTVDRARRIKSAGISFRSAPASTGAVSSNQSRQPENVVSSVGSWSSWTGIFVCSRRDASVVPENQCDAGERKTRVITSSGSDPEFSSRGVVLALHKDNTDVAIVTSKKKGKAIRRTRGNTPRGRLSHESIAERTDAISECVRLDHSSERAVAVLLDQHTILEFSLVGRVDVVHSSFSLT